MTYEINQSFELSCQIRPIKAFHPRVLLEVDTDTWRRFLSADAKLIWFYQYCAEHSFKGMVNTEFLKSENLQGIPSSEVEGGMASLFKEYWSATVYINGEQISYSISSGTYVANDRKERDLASNTLRKYAIGNALSQAGFGIVSGFNMTANEVAQYMQEMNLTAPDAAPTMPAVNPAAPAPQQPGTTQQFVMEDVFYGAAPVAPVSPVAPAAPLAPVPNGNADSTQYNIEASSEAPQQRDPLAEAKAMVWRGNGPNRNLSLGEILSKRGIKAIEYFAVEFTPRPANDPYGNAFKKAAQLILSSLQTGR